MAPPTRGDPSAGLLEGPPRSPGVPPVSRCAVRGAVVLLRLCAESSGEASHRGVIGERATLCTTRHADASSAACCCLCVLLGGFVMVAYIKGRGCIYWRGVDMGVIAHECLCVIHAKQSNRGYHHVWSGGHEHYPHITTPQNTLHPPQRTPSQQLPQCIHHHQHPSSTHRCLWKGGAGGHCTQTQKFH